MTKKSSPLDHKAFAQTACQYLKGVGPHVAKLLKKCGVFTLQDALFHLPYRYQDRTQITPIQKIRVGDWAVIEGVIQTAQFSRRQPRQRNYFICELLDSTGRISLRFFHITIQQSELLHVGARLRCYGEVRYSPHGLTMIHPEYQMISAHEALPLNQSLTPIYSTTEGLSQQAWRKVIDQALQVLSDAKALLEYLPQEILQLMQFSDLATALHFIHKPPPNTDISLLLARQHPMQLRLAFEELLAHHLSLRQRREGIQKEKAPRFILAEILEKKFLSKLSFSLTKAQVKVIGEIKSDLQRPYPMLRLVQGDVGSGKTVVAAISALQAVASDYQVALMVPTELLAEQHYTQFQRWLAPLNLQVAWLAGHIPAKQKQDILANIAQHKTNVVIGTHALFQEKVIFAKLGLVIIDEQHRFGVEQRSALRQKGFFPHQLIMTATPIPRTLAMTLYADLNCSIINELPPGRIPVKTVLINAQRREEVIARVRLLKQEKRQIYWVCSRIEVSETLQCQAAQSTAELLQQTLPELTVGLVHGRLKVSEKEEIMHDFKRGNIDLLVATTVIEVGVDVPNASVMVIENPERLGLAQLHQLRGRVGRGSVESYCILLYQHPLSKLAQERLMIMRDHQDGFIIAEKDLALRGPGEFLGTRQTGEFGFKVADLQRDEILFSFIQKAAECLSEKYASHIPLILDRWLGKATQFQEV